MMIKWPQIHAYVFILIYPHDDIVKYACSTSQENVGEYIVIYMHATP